MTSTSVVRLFKGAWSIHLRFTAWESHAVIHIDLFVLNILIRSIQTEAAIKVSGDESNLAKKRSLKAPL